MLIKISGTLCYEDDGSLCVFISMLQLMCVLDLMHQGDKSLISQGKLPMGIYKDAEVTNKGKVRVVRQT